MLQVGEIISRFEKKGFTLKGNSCSIRLLVIIGFILDLSTNNFIIVMLMAEVKVFTYLPFEL